MDIEGIQRNHATNLLERSISRVELLLMIKFPAERGPVNSGQILFFPLRKKMAPRVYRLSPLGGNHTEGGLPYDHIHGPYSNFRPIHAASS